MHTAAAMIVHKYQRISRGDLFDIAKHLVTNDFKRIVEMMKVTVNLRVRCESWNHHKSNRASMAKRGGFCNTEDYSIGPLSPLEYRQKVHS